MALETDTTWDYQSLLIVQPLLLWVLLIVITLIVIIMIVIIGIVVDIITFVYVMLLWL